MTTHYDYIIDDPVCIIDGYVSITIGTGPNAIVVKQKVKQLKNKGVYDADSLTIPNENHLEYIQWMITNLKTDRFDSMDIFRRINHARKLQSLAKNTPYIEIRQSTHIRTISELLRKAVIYIPKMNGKKPLYGLVDVEYADKVLSLRRF